MVDEAQTVAEATFTLRLGKHFQDNMLLTKPLKLHNAVSKSRISQLLYHLDFEYIGGLGCPK